jgi:hypothetical protein
MSVASFRDSIYSDNAVVEQIENGITLQTWLERSGYWEKMQQNPIVVLVNGDEVLEENYDYVINNNDVIELQQFPRAGATVAQIVTWVYYAVVAVSAIYVLTMPEPSLPETADVPDGSPTYSISVKGNRYRPESKGPVLYGRLRIVPDFDQPPFSTFDANNDQTLHMLFRITQGRASVDIGSLTFEDTPLSNFNGVTTEVLLPGAVPTLFPVGVVESNDISNLDIDTGYTAAYVANDVGTQITKIAVDLSSPNIAQQDKATGSLSAYTVRFEVQAQKIDDNNASIGNWIALNGVQQLTGDSRDPIRRTLEFNVEPGRYQVRIRRITSKSTSQYIQDTVTWMALKGFLHDPGDTSHCTRLAVSIRASEQIGNRALTDMSVIATRWLPSWNPTTGWQGDTPTKSIGWALADLCRASYAGNRSDLHYDLQRLYELDQQLTPLGHEFNAYYDTQGITVWDALVKTGLPGRITPIDKAGFYTFVRDEMQAQAVQAFTMRNIIRGSFKIQHTGVLEETADSVIVWFADEDNDYRKRSLPCALPDSPAQNPREMQLFGVTNATRAKELGMFYAASNRYRRKLTPFETGIEGRIPFYGSKIAISHYLLGAEGARQVSGDILSFDGIDRLRLSERVDDQNFNNPHIVMVDKAGKPMPAYPVTILEPFVVRVNGSPDWSQIPIESNYKAPMFVLGDGQTYVTESKVTKITRDGANVKVEAFVDDPRVYVYADDVIPPPSINIPAPETAAPELTELKAHVGGTVEFPVVTLSWSLKNADRTDIEISDDGGSTFAPIGRGFTRDNSFIHRPEPGQYIYRLAAVNLFRGPWVSVTVVTNAAAFTPPLPPTNLALREPFTGPVLKLQWDSGSQRHFIEVVVNGVVRFFETIEGEQWDFSGTLAQEWGVGRAFTVRVYAVGENGVTSETAAEIAVSNPPPAQLNNLVVQGLTGLAMIKFDWPAGNDIAGINVWMSSTPGFAPGDGNLVIDQSRDPVLSVPMESGATVYIRVAAVDVWGTDGLNISGEFETTAATVDLTEVYEELARLGDLFPITETSISDDAISTPKLQASAVDADKLAANSVIAGKIAALAVQAGNVAANAIKADNIDVAMLSAIAANMGLVTAGTFQTTSGTTPRVVISSSGSFPLWIGTGALVNAANAIMYMDTAGNLVYKGQLNVVSDSGGIRTEIDNFGGRVYENGQLLVRWGRW